VLVTGGAGFIGSHLAEALLNKGCEIRMVDNLSTGFMQNVNHLVDSGKITLIQGDVREYQMCRKAAEGVDLIFHEAAQINPAAAVRDAVADFEVNARGTLNMLDAARKEDVEKFVFASTNVYGNPRYLPVDEDHPVDLLSPYAAAKLSGEAYCIVYSNTYGVDTVRLRYTNVYGPRQRAAKSKSGVIPIFIERVLREQPPVIYGTGEQTRDFIYVSDVVEANILVAQNDECNGEVYNVGCGKEISIKQVAEQVIRTAGMRNLKPEYSPARVADFHRCAVDLKKIREATGFKPKVPFQEGLQRTIDWWRNNS
jgi:nucleoside-diphosphate-sugar epimerase